MAAANTDKFMEVGSPGTATTLSSPGYTSGVSTSINVASTTNWPTATGIVFAIDEATTDSDGNEVRVEGTYNEFVGTVASATSITNVDYVNGDAERSYSAGSTTRVYIPVSATRENRLAQGMVVEHNQDGTHGAITSTDATLTTPKVVTAINDSNGNEVLKVTATGSAVNEVTVANATTGNAPVLSATGGDTNIDLRLEPKGTGNVKRGSTGGAIDWWEEIGRTTLASNGDTITVSSMSARKNLRIIFTLFVTGTVNIGMTFNNDTGSNYAIRVSANGSADATSTSQVAVALFNSAGPVVFGEVQVANVATSEKIMSTMVISRGVSGAGNAPDRRDIVAKWANTSDQVTRVDITNSSTGDFLTGSEVIVLGHD